jgi:hypothetical protein
MLENSPGREGSDPSLPGVLSSGRAGYFGFYPGVLMTDIPVCITAAL